LIEIVKGSLIKDPKLFWNDLLLLFTRLYLFKNSRPLLLQLYLINFNNKMLVTWRNCMRLWKNIIVPLDWCHWTLAKRWSWNHFWSDLERIWQKLDIFLNISIISMGSSSYIRGVCRYRVLLEQLFFNHTVLARWTSLISPFYRLVKFNDFELQRAARRLCILHICSIFLAINIHEPHISAGMIRQSPQHLTFLRQFFFILNSG
jgi:hypothetical protein